jgi:hypothetical protein
LFDDIADDLENVQKKLYKYWWDRRKVF